jgi:hypothetical protein
MRIVKLEVLTYTIEEGPKIDYEALNLPEPEEERELLWQTRYFNLDILKDELLMVYTEIEDQTVFKFFDDRTIIIKGKAEEIVELLT